MSRAAAPKLVRSKNAILATRDNEAKYQLDYTQDNLQWLQNLDEDKAN